jgi:hypothetical protein
VSANIKGKRQSKLSANQLRELVEKAEQTDDNEKLKKYLEKIERFRGREIYNSLAARIKALKKKLAEQNPDEYQDIIREMVENEMSEKGISEGELDSDAQAALARLKNGQTNDPDQVDHDKNIISNNVYLKGSIKELDKLLEEYEKAPDEQAKKVIKNKIYNFISTQSSFYQQAYALKRERVDQLLGINSAQQQNTNKFPTFPVVVISSLLLFLIGSVVYLTRKQKVKKIKNN